MAREEVKKSGDVKGNGEMKNIWTDDTCIRERGNHLKENLKEKEASLGEKKTRRKRKGWGFPSHHHGPS